MASSTDDSPQAKTRLRRSRDIRRRLWMFVIVCSFLSTSLILWSTRAFPTRSLTTTNNDNHKLLRLSSPATTSFSHETEEKLESLRARLPPCVWSQAGRNSDKEVAKLVESQLTNAEKERATRLCGRFLFSSLVKAVRVADFGANTFVSTGDIDDMWTRDSAVQMSLYASRMQEEPFLRPILEGAIRRQAFNILQDPYANAYEKTWQSPSKLKLKDSVIGRGGWVATRNYELDSGAYFFMQLYDYYIAEGLYKPELVLAEPIVFDAVMLMVNTWIVEQHHDTQSPYRYFELSNYGKGPPTGYTGMTWTGFRPSDDPCKYSYHIPSNIFAAGSLERILVLNQRIWKSQVLHEKATKLLHDIEDGIRTYGIVKTEDTHQLIYAYEVDGLGNALADYDDANVPSLLSIPLLGWSKYNEEIYKTTRKRILSERNGWWFNGTVLSGMGSIHTGRPFVWPMSFAIQALTEDGTKQEIADSFVFQLRQSLTSACHDAMHESVSANKGCNMMVTRQWFEWSNALFVVLLESALGIRCDRVGLQQAKQELLLEADERLEADRKGNKTKVRYHRNIHGHNHSSLDFYQGVSAMIPHDVTSNTDRKAVQILR